MKFTVERAQFVREEIEREGVVLSNRAVVVTHFGFGPPLAPSFEQPWCLA